jgi:hypothetical protein
VKLSISVPDELWKLAEAANPSITKPSRLVQEALLKMTGGFAWCHCGELIYTEDSDPNPNSIWIHESTKKDVCELKFARPRWPIAGCDDDETQ